jgi:hypothetical protein
MSGDGIGTQCVSNVQNTHEHELVGHAFQTAFGLHPESGRGNVGHTPPALDRPLDVRAHSV